MEINIAVQRAKSGDQKAFKLLLDTFWNDVYGFLMKRTQNENDAEDITIQTFSRAFDKIDSYDENYVFKTWLMTIAKNIHIDDLRKKKVIVELPKENGDRDHLHGIADDTPTMEDRLITEQNLAQLQRDIKKLKPHYREVIQLRYFQELSYKEIAAQLDEPISNVKVKLLRAKKLLSQIIMKH